MDRAMRASENTMYNETGERRRNTVHKKDFSHYSKEPS